MIKAIRMSIIVFSMLGLCACKAIDLSELKIAATTAKACVAAPGPVPGASALLVAHMYGPLVLPLSAGSPPPGGSNSAPLDFAGYLAASTAALQPLPKDLRDDSVIQAFFKYTMQASALAQLSGPGAAHLSESARIKWKKDIEGTPLPSKLTYSQLKKFTKTAFQFGFHPNLASERPASGAGPNPFELYFRAYYEGNFVDRFGNGIAKPQLPSSLPTMSISLTITDSEIAAAETILLEYLFDLIDPTPVLGDGATAATSTVFYPGGTSASKPTVTTTSLAHYAKIGTAGCGVTQDNIVILTDIASAAADRATAMGGLTFNAAGGVGVSLGIFGKLSIGDNATLSTLAKTAVSRFAMRMTYAASFWALRDLGPANTPPAAAGAVPAAPQVAAPYFVF